MRWTRARIVIAASAAVVVATLVVGLAVALSGNTHPRIAAPLRPSPSPSPKPSVASQLVSPFTGEPVKSLGPVLAVKIDNIVYARPQTGINKADIVYVLPVEGGLTRFLVIFSSHIPPVVGPVRSAREDDIALLRQFGRPAFAFSGAQPHLLPVVERARIVNLYAGVVNGYYRDYQRIAPYNLLANTRQLLREAKGASKAHSIGFQFGPPPAGGRRTASESVSYPFAHYTFTWSQARQRWLVSIDGARAETTDGGQMSAPTIVIQHTLVSTSRFPEQGRRPPYASTVGHGTAIVLRNGRAYQARWSRPRLNGGTTFTMMNGQPMPFALGPVWIVLVGNPANEIK